MKEIPLVSVLIVNFRGAKQAVQCVQEFLKQTIADKIEIIVVDNHSDDDSIGILRNQLPSDRCVRLIETSKNLGFGSGYNAAARFARGTFLLINNPVKILDLDAVELLVKKMEAETDIGILSPKLVYPDGTLRSSARSLPRPLDLIIKRSSLQHLFPERLEHYLQLDKDPDQERNADWVIGGCFMIRRALFEAVGGFDDRFFLFFEDTDICRKVSRLSMRIVYYPSAKGRDRKRRLSDGSILSLLTTKVGRTHVTSAFRYFAKWGARG